MDVSFDRDIQTVNVSRKFLRFLEEYTVEDPSTGELRKPYVEQAQQMILNERTTIYVDFGHFTAYQDLAEAILLEFYRHEAGLRKAVQTFVFNLFKDAGRDKLYYVAFHNFSNIDKIRNLKTDRIGKLTAITGTITRTTEVRPELVYGSFVCTVCNSEIRDIEQQFRYTEPKLCSNPNCGNRIKWELSTNDSVFCDWQKLRVQENANEIPTGGMPRSIDIILRNEMVDQAKPGDRCVFVGTLIVVPEIVSLLKPGEKSQVDLRKEGLKRANQKGFEGVSGLKQLGVRDLNYKMVFLASFVQSTLNRFDLNIRDEQRDEEVLNQFTTQEREEILSIKDQPDLYRRLAKSISPSVFGHEEIKKGLLLMLFGGVSDKQTPEGMRLRGDINLCIVGDPSTAKSQFLKFVCGFLPRTVYTSGKATSAAGLTAAVQRDPDTGEFCLEAGALMLADNGICCIDEFDKMDIKDQVAIHEAMEQQTISIAKAGIQATLNARCSILAAANPIFGRYDKSKSLKFNLDMSAPIMSRFDLFFVVLDECNEFVDYSIAQHIVNLHRNKEEAIQADFTTQQLQRYIRFARTIKPELSHEAALELRESYKKLRLNDVTYQKSAYRITVRQLESMVRLSEALARVHCSKTITPEYVKEAARLLSNSILRVERPDLEIEPFDENIDLNANIKPTDTNILEEELREMRIEEQKKAKITLTYDDYIKIAKTLTYYFKEQEREGRADAGIKQKDAVNWFIEQNFSNIETVEQAEQFAKIAHSVVQRLISQEKVLIIVRDDPDYKERILQLHPNHTENI